MKKNTITTGSPATGIIRGQNLRITGSATDKGRKFAEDEADFIDSQLDNPTTGECDHQWTDYGTLTSGDNPKLEIESCVRCGVQRKKSNPTTGDYGVYPGVLSESKPTTGEWTDYEARWLWKRGWQIVKDRHNAALAAEREAKESAEANCDRLATEKHRKHQEIQQLREQLAAAVEAVKGMLSVYEELHARYDLGDCQATVDARAALAKIGGTK